MRRALDRTGSVKYIAHTRPTPAEPTEEIPPSKASVVAAAKSKRVNATWAMAPSIAGVLVPLVFVLMDTDFFVRVPLSAVVSGVLAALLHHVPQARWLTHPAAIVVSYLGALLIYISRLGP